MYNDEAVNQQQFVTKIMQNRLDVKTNVTKIGISSPSYQSRSLEHALFIIHFCSSMTVFLNLFKLADHLF